MDLFLAKWEEKKNPLQILAEYNALKRNTNEFVQDCTARFNLIYNSILDNIKPPPGLALLHYPDDFDPDMAYQLRKRIHSTLEEMQRNVASVEVNLLIKKSKKKSEKKVNIKEEPSTS